MFPKNTPPMAKGNWKSALAFSPTSTVKLSPKELTPRSEPKKPEKTKVKHKNGNTKREITKKTAEEVKARDVNCILCKMPIQQIHHCYYGPQSCYTPNRNDVDQLVGLCNSCHHKLHNESNDYRQFCIDYLCNLPTK